MEKVTILMPLAPTKVVFPSEPNIPERPDYEKYQHYIDARGEVLPTSLSYNDSYILAIRLRDANQISMCLDPHLN